MTEEELKAAVGKRVVYQGFITGHDTHGVLVQAGPERGSLVRWDNGVTTIAPFNERIRLETPA